MILRRSVNVAAIILAFVLEGRCPAADPAPGDIESAIHRSVRYLAGEVPLWREENGCCSCHNNGDGVRALVAAARGGHWEVVAKRPVENVLANSIGFLSRPGEWANNGGDGEFNDRKLAAIQFSAALAALSSAGPVISSDGAPKAETLRESLLAAAQQVTAEQSPDGSWRIDTAGQIGSPVTYGPVLATAFARDVLRDADRERFAKEIAAANAWLLNREPRTVMDAAAILIGSSETTGEAAAAQRTACHQILKEARHADGAWGPYVISSPEPFDTALVLLALRAQPPDPERDSWISAARDWLIAEQQLDGSWTETTRPAGGTSYAHRVSTTAWAVMALMATSEATAQ